MPNPVIDAQGPVFVSYAWEDGKVWAESCADALQGGGVPVWFDDNDMGVGRFDRTIHQAAADGLSGVVLFASRAVSTSVMIQTVEGPLWRQMLNDPAFVFTVVNVHDGDGDVDYGLPEEVLPGPGDQLRFYKQYPTSDAAWLDRLVDDVTRERVRLLRVIEPLDALAVEINTRGQKRTHRSSGHMRATLAPPGQDASVPPPAAAQQLRRLTRLLPNRVADLDRRLLQVSGAMHLSVAFAVGACVTTTSGIGLAFEDRDGNWWRSVDDVPPVLLEEYESEIGGMGSVAVYVDLVRDAPIDAAFERDFVDIIDGPTAALHIVPTDHADIPAVAGAATAVDIASRLRRFASDHQTREIHLCLRTPAALAALLGRHMNTLTVHVYEWERTFDPPRYVKFAQVTPGGAGGNALETP